MSTVAPVSGWGIVDESLLDSLLDRHPVFLHLPPFVVHAVVSNGQFEFQIIHATQAKLSR